MIVRTKIGGVGAHRVSTRGRGVIALLGLCTLASLAACRVQPLTIPGKARDPREMPGSTADQGARDADPAVASKRVAAKERAYVLVAEDGSRCSVTESRYNNTRIGDTVFCAWRTSDRAP